MSERKKEREEISKKFGAYVRRERAWARLTQQQLGEQVSMSQGQISLVEWGKVCPHLDTVVRLLACLGIDPREAMEALD
jgi:ribosome-binding protein aMBF1 (putative translation factor)